MDIKMNINDKTLLGGVDSGKSEVERDQLGEEVDKLGEEVERGPLGSGDPSWQQVEL